jgi:hypothetical protein
MAHNGYVLARREDLVHLRAAVAHPDRRHVVLQRCEGCGIQLPVPALSERYGYCMACLEDALDTARRVDAE